MISGVVGGKLNYLGSPTRQQLNQITKMPSAISPPPAPASKAGDAAVPTSSKKRKMVCFSDFDGTIALQDTGHILFNTYGCGSKKRELLDAQINSGERTFKDVSEEMWGSLNVPFEDGFELMAQELKMDPGFAGFHRFCVREEIPFHVISAGLKPVLRRVLDEFLGEEESARIGIVANEAEIKEDGSEWRPVWRHGGSELGHDKAVSMKEARREVNREVAGRKLESGEGEEEVPLIVFIGDGVSDLPAAREADVLFARKGLRLEGYCVEHGIKYLPFDSFADIQGKLEEILKEDEEKTGGKGKPARFNPRANMWRRVSSRNAVPRYVVMTPKEERMFLWPEAFGELVGSNNVAGSRAGVVDSKQQLGGAAVPPGLVSMAFHWTVGDIVFIGCNGIFGADNSDYFVVGGRGGECIAEKEGLYDTCSLFGEVNSVKTCPDNNRRPGLPDGLDRTRPSQVLGTLCKVDQVVQTAVGQFRDRALMRSCRRRRRSVVETRSRFSTFFHEFTPVDFALCDLLSPLNLSTRPYPVGQDTHNVSCGHRPKQLGAR
ncbi:HAD-like domain-containing protein [Triangularia verruculosa]|uniref:HAD-like domain-containing protein n=1 Tax=Triangularia verruculosa TaxID=2587418 RepID=A0AAN7AQT3_9PEZI|nr:HAD-like domain-containing protein [Triangularia verruculosa]